MIDFENLEKAFIQLALTEKYYYHATEMLFIPSILREGLRCGFCGNIYFYKGGDVDMRIMNFIKRRILRRRELALKMGNSTVYRLLKERDFGIGVIRIDKKELDFYNVFKDNAYSHGCYYVHKDVIHPSCIQFAGYFNEQTQKLTEPPFYLSVYDYISKRISKGEY